MATPLVACLIEKLKGVTIILFVCGSLQYCSAEDIHCKPHYHVMATQLHEIMARVVNMQDVYWMEMKAIVPDNVSMMDKQWIAMKDMCKAEGTEEFCVWQHLCDIQVLYHGPDHQMDRRWETSPYKDNVPSVLRTCLSLFWII